MALQAIGLSAVLDDANFQAGLARYITGLGKAEQKTDQTAGSISRFGGIIQTALGTALGVLTAQALPSLLNGIGGVFDASRAWSEQLDQLGDLLGLSGPAASQYAVALNTVGVSVEEGGSALNYFVRSLGQVREAMGTAVTSYTEAMSDLRASHADVLAELTANWLAAQQDLAEQTAQIWQDLADHRAEIETNLGDTISGIRDSLAERLTELEYNWTQQLESFARDRAKIYKEEAKAQADLAKETARDLEKVETDRARSLEDLVRTTADRTRKAKTFAEVQAIVAEANARAKDIEQQAADRRAEIEQRRAERQAEIVEQRKERLADLAARRKEAEEQYQHQAALADKQAEKQIAVAEKSAAKQIEVAEKQAAKQEAVLEKQFKKQAELYDKQVEKENKNFAKQAEKLAETLNKASASNPLAKALKQLGVNAFDATGEIRPFEELLPQIMDAFSKLPPGIDAGALALQLFGRGGSKFLDFLRLGSKGLTQAQKDAEAWGLTVSTESRDAAEEFGFNLNRLGLAATGLKKVIGDAVLPILSELVGDAVTFAREHMPEILTAVRGFTDWLKLNLEPGLRSGADALKPFYDAFKEKGLQGLFEQLQVTLDKNWPKVQQMLGDLVGRMMSALNDWLAQPQVQEAIGKMGASIARALINGFMSIFQSPESVGQGTASTYSWLKGVQQQGEKDRASIFGQMATGGVLEMAKKFLGVEASESMKGSINGMMQSAVTTIFKGPVIWAIDFAVWTWQNLQKALAQMDWKALWDSILGALSDWYHQFDINPANPSGAGYDTGGVIPGPRGRPRLVMAHAGETILPTHRVNLGMALARVNLPASASSISRTLNFNIGSVYGVADFDYRVRQIIDAHDRGH